MDLMTFITVVILAFSLVMVLAGLFTAYFGTGLSRTIGLVLVVVGLVVGIIWAYLTGFSNIEPFCAVGLGHAVYEAILSFIGILIGALIAVGIFLYSVMKS